MGRFWGSNGGIFGVLRGPISGSKRGSKKGVRSRDQRSQETVRGSRFAKEEVGLDGVAGCELSLTLFGSKGAI